MHDWRRVSLRCMDVQACIDTHPARVEHGIMDLDRPEELSRIPLLLALAAAPILVLLARMPTNEAPSTCGMIRPWNDSATAQLLVCVALVIAFKAVRGAWRR